MLGWSRFDCEIQHNSLKKDKQHTAKRTQYMFHSSYINRRLHLSAQRQPSRHQPTFFFLFIPASPILQYGRCLFSTQNALCLLAAQFICASHCKQTAPGLNLQVNREPCFLDELLHLTKQSGPSEETNSGPANSEKRAAIQSESTGKDTSEELVLLKSERCVFSITQHLFFSEILKLNTQNYKAFS